MPDENQTTEPTEHQEELIEEVRGYASNFVLARSAALEALQHDSGITVHHDTYGEIASEIAHIVMARQREDFYRRADRMARSQERLHDRVINRGQR